LQRGEPLFNSGSTFVPSYYSQIVNWYKVDEAGEVWALMTRLNVLDDLLRMKELDSATDLDIE
jgi:hypothetical protein